MCHNREYTLYFENCVRHHLHAVGHGHMAVPILCRVSASIHSLRNSAGSNLSGLVVDRRVGKRYGSEAKEAM